MEKVESEEEEESPVKPSLKNAKIKHSRQFDHRLEKPHYGQYHYHERDPYACGAGYPDEFSRKRSRGSDYSTWMDEFLGTSLKMDAVRDKREYDQLARDRARFDHLSNVNHQRELELARAKHNN